MRPKAGLHHGEMKLEVFSVLPLQCVPSPAHRGTSSWRIPLLLEDPPPPGGTPLLLEGPPPPGGSPLLLEGFPSSWRIPPPPGSLERFISPTGRRSLRRRAGWPPSETAWIQTRTSTTQQSPGRKGLWVVFTRLIHTSIYFFCHLTITYTHRLNTTR